jgi:hypothetical protein
MSDDRDYIGKNALLKKIIYERPDEFKVDSYLNRDYVGITHKPSGFKIHAQKKIVPSQLINSY